MNLPRRYEKEIVKKLKKASENAYWTRKRFECQRVKEKRNCITSKEFIRQQI